MVPRRLHTGWSRICIHVRASERRVSLLDSSLEFYSPTASLPVFDCTQSRFIIDMKYALKTGKTERGEEN